MNMRISCLMAVLVMATGCASSYPYSKKQIQVENLSVDHTVQFAHGSAVISAQERSALEQRIMDIRGQAVSQVMIDVNAESDLSQSRASAIRSYLIRSGFPTQVFTQQRVRSVKPSTALKIVYAVAMPPANCPDWASRAAPNFSNQLFSNYRCTTQHNLARQIANPNDLVRGSGDVSGDNDRSQVAITQYKANTVVPPEPGAIGN